MRIAFEPKSKGGSNRVSNLTLSCRPCNIKKGSKTIQEFLKKKPKVLKTVLANAKKPLRDAAAVNTTRWALYRQLKTTGLNVEVGSGGLTKFNRTKKTYQKPTGLMLLVWENLPLKSYIF